MKFLQISSLFIFMFINFNFVSAQQLQIPSNISASCQAEIQKLASSSDLSSCASFIKLYALQNKTMQSAASLTPIYDSYCAAPKCNDNTTSADATELKSQCQSDLTAKDPTVTYLKNVLIFNSPLKDSLCFKNSSGGYCDLDPNSDLINYIIGLNATPPANISCNDCNKAILNSFANYFKSNPQSVSELSFNTTSFENSVTTQCGSSFLNGTIPNTNGSNPSSGSNPGTGTGSGSNSGSNSNPKTGSGVSIHSPSFTGFTVFTNAIIVASFIILIDYVI
ncbi:26671_t:CDS:2 [Dentiscutata erythropus]|uniref:26671_t:CDS:1 n=1 Tax=Dentiscutata erythropus TaxID=1348616 RepID=A0A9N8Z6B7_9GLOM|nr:26671_t:CDS:2 [Dentiscutata erythropus]